MKLRAWALILLSIVSLSHADDFQCGEKLRRLNWFKYDSVDVWKSLKDDHLGVVGPYALYRLARSSISPVLTFGQLLPLLKHALPGSTLAKFKLDAKMRAIKIIENETTQFFLFFMLVNGGLHPIVIYEVLSTPHENEIYELADLKADTENEKNVLFVSFHKKAYDLAKTKLNYDLIFAKNPKSKFMQTEDLAGLVKSIKDYVKEHGPLDSLVIQTHGNVGILATSNALIELNSIKDMPELEGMFSANAKIVFDACMVGGRTLIMDRDGSTFCETFGSKFLDKGGTVFSAKRSLSMADFPPEATEDQKQEIAKLLENINNTDSPGLSSIAGFKNLAFFIEQQILQLKGEGEFRKTEIAPRQKK